MSPLMTGNNIVDENGFIDCDLCGGGGFIHIDAPVGHPDYGKVIRCQNPKHSMTKLERMMKLSELHPDQLNIRLSDIKRYDKIVAGQLQSNHEVLDGIERYLQKPRGILTIWGTWGNAKTDLAIAVLNHLREDHYRPGIYLTLSRLIGWLNEAYSEKAQRQSEGLTENWTKESRLNGILNTDVLVIDEFDLTDDKIRQTPNLHADMFRILDSRYTHAVARQSVTVLVTNSNPNGYPESWQERILDGRMKVLHNTAPSKRRFMTWGDEGDDGTKVGS
jgi:DNA replication protein DnaC